MYQKLIVTICLIVGAAAVGCQPDNSPDTAAEHLENAGDELEAAATDVAEDAKDMAETARNQVEDACEEAKEKAGAADTDC